MYPALRSSQDEYWPKSKPVEVIVMVTISFQALNQVPSNVVQSKTAIGEKFQSVSIEIAL